MKERNKDKIMNKNCGTCRWSSELSKKEELNVATGPKRLNCNWEVFHSLPVSIRISTTTYMFEYEGTNCTCWEKKNE